MDKKIKEYAKLIVEIGTNIQKGQKLMINAPVDCAYFVRLCASAAYDAGCAEVIINWSDDYLTREKYLKASDEIFDTVPEWRVKFFNDCANEGTARLSIYASDPENMKGVPVDRIQRQEIANGNALKDYREKMMANAFPWCVASIPIPSWAKKVSQNSTEDEAMNTLWNMIFQATRISGDGKAVDKWKEHINIIKERCNLLNNFDFKYLHYTNSLGTDLSIELPENHIWMGGSENTLNGQEFVANIPTEEIFTAPKKHGVNGKVVASLPLVKDGNIINGILFEFKDGKIIKATSETNEEILKAAISVDEGASYLGEVALVPFNSPISNMKTLFYNTLFDENASCHLAFGEAYPCLKDANELDSNHLKERGLNNSITHEDFMIGTSDLNIIGITHKGEKIPVFIDGNFAF